MIQNTILILSQDTQERIAQESLLRQISLFRLLSLLYKTEAKQNFVWLTTWRHFHDIFTIFSRYSACIISVICVKSRDLRSVITIFSRLMIFSRYFHDSRYFQDIFTTFSRWLKVVICIISVFCIQSRESWKYRENIVKISWKYRQHVAHSKLSKTLEASKSPSFLIFTSSF